MHTSGIPPLPESVQYLQVDMKKFALLWQKFSQFPVLGDISQDINVLVQKLSARDSIWLERKDGTGVLYATNVIPGVNATVHAFFWDRKLKAKIPDTLEAIRWLFRHPVWDLQKLNIFIPETATAAARMAGLLGFQKEGMIRRYAKDGRGRLYDLQCFGLLREEALADE